MKVGARHAGASALCATSLISLLGIGLCSVEAGAQQFCSDWDQYADDLTFSWHEDGEAHEDPAHRPTLALTRDPRVA